jgi:hypothetical protein
MTYQQFTSLPKDMQARLTKEKGIFIAARSTKYALVKLYQVESFYVELYHDKKIACISIVNSFEDTERLQPYLQKIDVSEVQQLLS